MVEAAPGMPSRPNIPGRHARIQRPFQLNGRYQLIPRRKGLNNLTTSMARVRFLVYPYKTERSQYLDVALHGGTIPFESYGQVRNWRRLQANRMDHSNAL